MHRVFSVVYFLSSLVSEEQSVEAAEQRVGVLTMEPSAANTCSGIAAFWHFIAEQSTSAFFTNLTNTVVLKLCQLSVNYDNKCYFMLTVQP